MASGGDTFKPVEYLHLLILRNTDTVISYLYLQDTTGSNFCRKPDAHFLSGILQGIVHQIGQDLLQAEGIGRNPEITVSVFLRISR